VERSYLFGSMLNSGLPLVTGTMYTVSPLNRKGTPLRGPFGLADVVELETAEECGPQLLWATFPVLLLYCAIA
jgi:hypothetical protein